MTKPNSRAAAIHILCQWQKSHSTINPLVEHQTNDMTESRDRQLVKAIVFGVLRHLNSLDFILTKFSRHPLHKMQPAALEALRSGLYQILFMDRIPESAILNETIKALKSAHHPKWLTGFVNGVLRNICRKKNEIIDILTTHTLPMPVQCDHPEWLLERWQDRFGKQETLNICQVNNQPAPLCLRVNQTKTSRQDFLDLLLQHKYSARPGVVPESVWLQGAGAVEQLPGYDEGLFSIQDETAQLITCLLAPFIQGDYLDACAGLGGKTMALAQTVPKGSTIWAVEPHKKRQHLLKENLDRLALHNVRCFHGTLTEFADTTEIKFRAVLVDAPCSGLGVIGRHPDIRWNRQPEDLPHFQKTQLSLLKTAAQLLAPGGVLVYATCSMEPEENEEVIKIFLKNNPQFLIKNPQDWLPEKAIHHLDKHGCLRTIPSKSNQDGFFAVRLEKQ